MIVSGGKILAIDAVSHDNTLSGDGIIEPLGVIGGNTTATFGKWMTLSSDDSGVSWRKVNGYGIEFDEGAKLNENSTYLVNTTVCINTTSAQPLYNEYTLDVDNTKYDLVNDESILKNNWYQYSKVIKTFDVKKLNTKLTTKDNHLGNVYLYQNIIEFQFLDILEPPEPIIDDANTLNIKFKDKNEINQDLETYIQTIYDEKYEGTDVVKVTLVDDDNNPSNDINFNDLYKVDDKAKGNVAKYTFISEDGEEVSLNDLIK